jgi:hypothetical protein
MTNGPKRKRLRRCTIRRPLRVVSSVVVAAAADAAAAASAIAG